MYGVWDDRNKRYVFGIAEVMPGKAWRKFLKVCNNWRSFNYSTREISPGHKNPPNPRYHRR